jgi:outer membrane protein TolC
MRGFRCLGISWRSGTILLLGMTACLSLLSGCHQFRPGAILYPSRSGVPSVDRAAPIRPVVFQTEEKPLAVLPQPGLQGDHRLPINLDSVFRMAADQNVQIQLGREKLNEAFTEMALAEKKWLPDIYAGLGYYRHEGAIQDQDGRFIHSSFGSLFAGFEVHGVLDLKNAVYQKIQAERKIWQQRGELARINSETLLDASSTYMDLLAAQTGLSISLQTEELMTALLEKTKRMAKVEPESKLEVELVESELLSQKQITRELREGARSASVKLVRLLGLDPDAVLVAVDAQIVPLELVAGNLSEQELVGLAARNGPGVQELAGLLALIQSTANKSGGMDQLLPTFELRAAEGGFGAGPGSELDWGNRFDLAFQMRWNLTSALTAREQKCLLQSKVAQAQLGYRDLQEQLALGVRQAYSASMAGKERINLGRQYIQQREKVHELTQYRLQERFTLKGSPSEVLLSLRALSGARFTYLNTVRDYNKSQLRLLVLTGLNGGACRE